MKHFAFVNNEELIHDQMLKLYNSYFQILNQFLFKLDIKDTQNIAFLN